MVTGRSQHERHAADSIFMSTTSQSTNERSRRWRLILGNPAEEQGGIGGSGGLGGLEGADLAMDAALSALYDSERKGGLGASLSKRCPLAG